MDRKKVLTHAVLSHMIHLCFPGCVISLCVQKRNKLTVHVQLTSLHTKCRKMHQEICIL